MDSRSSVRSFVRPWRDIWRSAHQIFLKLCPESHLGETKKMFQADFWKKWSKTAKNHIMPPQCIFEPKMDKTTKTRVFSDTTLAFDDWNLLSPVSDQVLEKSDVRIRRKCAKTWFLSKNGQILDQKRVQKWPRFFCQNKNCHWPFLNNKLSSNNKN